MPWYELTVRVETDEDTIGEIADRVAEVVCGGDPETDDDLNTGHDLETDRDPETGHVCARQWVLSVGPVTDTDPEDDDELGPVS